MSHINFLLNCVSYQLTSLFPDYIIPKGWKVLVWYGAVHMDPEIYDNPQNFNPSRWDVSAFYFDFFFSRLFFILFK